MKSYFIIYNDCEVVMISLTNKNENIKHIYTHAWSWSMTIEYENLLKPVLSAKLILHHSPGVLKFTSLSVINYNFITTTTSEQTQDLDISKLIGQGRGNLG